MNIVQQATATNLSPDELGLCAKIARGLARQAADNHRQGIERASSVLSAIMDEYGSDLCDAGRCQYGVTVRRGTIVNDDATHVVALAKFIGGEVAGFPIEVAIRTALYTKPTTTCMLVGYETTAKVLVPEGAVDHEAEDPSTPCLVDVMDPLVVEERVV